MGCSVKAASEDEEKDKEKERYLKKWIEKERRQEEREGTSEELVRTAYSVHVDGEEINEFVGGHRERDTKEAKEGAFLYAMKLRENGETREISVIEYSTYETRTRETNEYLVANIPAGNKFPPADF